MADTKATLNKAAQALGRKGGRKRAANLTPEQLSAIGRMGGKARAKAAKEREAK